VKVPPRSIQNCQAAIICASYAVNVLKMPL
jgi:hypothetical protein